MNKVKTIKVKNEDGSISEESYSIAADALNIDMVNGKNVQETIGTIDVDKDGDIATQLNKKINKNDIIDNLDSSDNNKVLSAKQGKVLNEAVVAANSDIKKKIYYFNTIAEMKEDENLVAGDTCQILEDTGLYEIINDNSVVINNQTVFKLDNGLKAQLLYYTDINKQYYTLYQPCLGKINDLGAFNLLVFSNGFTILNDCGYTGQETTIQTFLASINISHLDVVMVTHFHADHSGCFEFIARNYCDNRTLFFRQMKCDYSRFPDPASEQQEQNYTNVLTELGYLDNSRIPSQNEIVSLLNGMIKLRFLNTDSSFADSYYNSFSDTNTNNYLIPSLNNFSLICEVTALNKKVLFTGDVETQAQINNEQFIEKCDIMQVPHHNWNHNGYYKFFDRISPEIAYFNRNTTLADYNVYWSKYQRQRVGYKPTYYTYNRNVEIDISNVGINILNGTVDNTFTVPNGQQEIGTILPFCTDYETPYFSYKLWTIKNVLDMFRKCDNKVYSVPIRTSGRDYTKLKEEIQSMTGASVDWLLTTNTNGFEIQRLSNWNGIIYKFIGGFDYDNVSTYINCFGGYLSPFTNNSVNENLNLSEGQNTTLVNQLRIPPTLEATIRTYWGSNDMYHKDYTIILHHKGSGTYEGNNINLSISSEKTIVTDAMLSIRIVNNVLYVDSCKAIVYNATDSQTSNRRGELLKLNSTTLI